MQYSLFKVLLGVQSLLALPGIEAEKPRPVEALYGEWEVVEMTYRGRVEKFFGGQNGGWFVFEPGGFIRVFDAAGRDKIARDKRFRKAITERCTIRLGEIDLLYKYSWNKHETLTKAIYDFKDDMLRIAWPHVSDEERPPDFDKAAKDPKYDCFILKKVK